MVETEHRSIILRPFQRAVKRLVGGVLRPGGGGGCGAPRARPDTVEGESRARLAPSRPPPLPFPHEAPPRPRVAALGEGPDLGILVGGGNSGTSRKTPQEIATAADRHAITASDRLVYSSRMSAKVDSAAVQDSFPI